MVMTDGAGVAEVQREDVIGGASEGLRRRRRWRRREVNADRSSLQDTPPSFEGTTSCNHRCIVVNFDTFAVGFGIDQTGICFVLTSLCDVAATLHAGDSGAYVWIFYLDRGMIELILHDSFVLLILDICYSFFFLESPVQVLKCILEF
jgi:hypothetical protein